MRFDAFRITRRHEQPQLAIEKLDYHRVGGEQSKRRLIGVGPRRLQQVSSGKVRGAAADRREAAGAADGGHEKGRGLGLCLVEIVQYPEAWVVAPRGQQKSAFFGAGFSCNKTRSALLNPLVNQLLRESPLAGNPRARDLAGLGKEIDFLLIDPQVAGDFPGVHQLRHISFLETQTPTIFVD